MDLQKELNMNDVEYKAWLDKLARAGSSANEIENAECKERMRNEYAPPYISVSKATRVFYNLIYLEGTDKHSKQIASFQSIYNEKFARALYDYAVGAITGELRHFTFSDYKVRPQLKGSRSKTIAFALSLDDESLLNVAEKAFDNEGWSSSYGGEAWLNITKATKNFYYHSRIRFIDDLIHQRHCGGRLFDRPIIFLDEQTDPFVYNGIHYYYQEYLDLRRDGAIDNYMDSIKYSFDDLLKEYEETIDQILNYKGAQFGLTKVKLVYMGYDEPEPREDEEQENEQEEEEEEPETQQSGSYKIPAMNLKVKKSQKEINSKPFLYEKISPYLTQYYQNGFIKLYVSSKFGGENVQTLKHVMDNANVYLGMTKFKVYFIFDYVSKGKTYKRIASFVCFSPNLKSKIEKKLVYIAGITSNKNTVKVYIDKLS